MKSVFATALLAACSYAMPIGAAPKWAAGLIYGLVGDNHLLEIEACAHDGEAMVPKIEKVIADFESGMITQAVEELILVAKDIPNLLSDCKNMDDDIAAVEEWATIFESKTKLVATVSKNFLLHKKAIKADIADAKAAWALHEYFSAGVTCADLSDKAIGPITPHYPAMYEINDTNEAVANFDAMSIPDFIAGFIYGMTGDNDLQEIEACYQGSQEINFMLQHAIDDLKKGGWDNYTQAAIEFGLAALIFPQALETCENIQDDLAEIEDWAVIFTNPAELTKTVTKNYLLHKKRIDGDIEKIEADQAADNYWQMGIDTADLLTVAVGPMQ